MNLSHTAVTPLPKMVTVQPPAELLLNPAHWKFAYGEGLDSLLAKCKYSYGLCNECKFLG